MGQKHSVVESPESIIAFNGKHYDYERELGESAFGKVYLVKERSTEKLYAIKIINKDKFDNPGYSYRNFKSFKSLSHENIIKVFDVFEDTNSVYLLMEYSSGGNLLDYIQERKINTERRAKEIAREIVAGIEYLHSKGISHRNLKPQNILFDQFETIKIADFGLVNEITKDVYTESLSNWRHTKMLPRNGTSNKYCSSEIFNKSARKCDGFKADIYALGIILNDIITNAHVRISPEYQNLHKKLTCKDPSSRLSIKEVIKNRWLV